MLEYITCILFFFFLIVEGFTHKSAMLCIYLPASIFFVRWTDISIKKKKEKRLVCVCFFFANLLDACAHCYPKQIIWSMKTNDE